MTIPVEPGACRHCDIPERGHYRQIASAEQGGMHVWQPPTQEQIKARMLARHAATHIPRSTP